MKKLLIVLVLVAASAAPAFADYGKEPTTPRYQRHVVGHERHSELRGRRALLDMRQPNDPYWAPCDYTTTADPNGCE